MTPLQIKVVVSSLTFLTNEACRSGFSSPPPHFCFQPTQRNKLQSVSGVCDPQATRCCATRSAVCSRFFPLNSLLRLQDFEGESGELLVISALTPLFIPITPPFLLHWSPEDAAALCVPPSLEIDPLPSIPLHSFSPPCRPPLISSTLSTVFFLMSLFVSLVA